jgi:hypothetical protein
MLVGEMMMWWVSSGFDVQGESIVQLPCPLVFFFSKPLPKIPTPFGFFWVGSSTWAHGGGLIFLNFLFLVSHFLNHVGMRDLLLVPHWWKKKYTIIHPNQIKLNSYFFQLLFLTINLTNCFQPINHLTRIIFFLFINNQGLKFTNFDPLYFQPKFYNPCFLDLVEKNHGSR